MSRQFTRLALLALSVMALTVIFTVDSPAQAASRVRFAGGAVSAVAAGSLNGYKDKRTFVIKVRAGQTLTTEQGDTGSYAMSQTHLQVRKDVVDSDKQLVEYWLNELIKWIIDFNFESVPEIPKFVMYEEQDVDMTLAQRDQALASTNQIKFTKEYFKRNYGFKDDEIEIVSAPPQIFPFSENSSEIQKSPYDISQFDELTQAVLKPILDMIENGTSYNEIQDKIVEMFPDLETSELEDFLAKGILIATGSGFISGKK